MFSWVIDFFKSDNFQAWWPFFLIVVCCPLIYWIVWRLFSNEDIELSNTDLEKELDDYLKIEKPDFAVMITGSWGIGKTYFIKRYIEKKNRHVRFWNRPVYLSLYSIKSEKQLEMELFKSLFLSLSWMNCIFIIVGIIFIVVSVALAICYLWKITAILKFIRWPVLLAIGVFCYKLFKFNILDWVLGRKLIVFDDLERIQIPIKDLFALINRFVEHLQKHVVVICDESKIQKSPDYTVIKEKFFGKTFKFSSPSMEIIRSFISQKDTPLLHELINTMSFDWFYERSVVRKIPVNLRAFRHVAMEFERFFRKVDRNKLFDKAIIKHLIPDFFCVLYSFECPEFSPGEIFDFNKLNITVKPLEDNQENEWLNKYFPYAFQNFNQSLLPMDYWEALVQHKNVVTQKINEYWEILIHGDQRLFVRSFSLSVMSDQGINDFLQELKKQMKSKKLCNPYEILCVVGNLLDCFGSSHDKIQKHAKKYIALLEKGNFFPDEFLNLAVFLKFKFSHENLYASYPIPCAHTATGKELKNYLTDKLCTFYVQNKKKLFEKYLQQLGNYDDEENLQWWLKHSEVDLFSNLGVDDSKRLFDVLIALNEKDFRSQLCRLTNHLGEIVDQAFNNISFWTRFNEIAKFQVAEWEAGNKMFSKNRSLKSFCASVDRYIADAIIIVAEKERNKTLNNPEKDSDQ